MSEKENCKEMLKELSQHEENSFEWCAYVSEHIIPFIEIKAED